jgi:hypothetical protein
LIHVNALLCGGYAGNGLVLAQVTERNSGSMMVRGTP